MPPVNKVWHSTPTNRLLRSHLIQVREHMEPLVKVYVNVHAKRHVITGPAFSPPTFHWQRLLIPMHHM